MAPMDAAGRANVWAAGRQLARRLSLATNTAQRREPAVAPELRGDWLALGDALDTADEAAIKRLVAKYEEPANRRLLQRHAVSTFK